MELYFLRHGTSEDKKPHQRDEHRRLTEQGIEEARVVATALKGLGVNFDSIITSPLVRAKETASVVAEVVGFARNIVEIRGLSPGSTFTQLMKELPTQLGVDRVLLVGHQPTIGRMIAEACSGHSGDWIDIEKAGLALLDIDTTSARAPQLKWLLTQNHLAQIAGRGEV